MTEYITSFFEEFEFSSTEKVCIAVAYEKILENDDANIRFNKIIEGYEKDVSFIKESHSSEIDAISSMCDAQPHTVELLLLICLTKTLRERLTRLGMTKRNVYNTLQDVKYKMKENETLYGIVGTSKWQWFTRLLRPGIFAFGRLQYEISPFDLDYYEKDGKSVKKGAPVLKIHIPTPNEPLESADCSASFREAKKFFTKLLNIPDIPFICSSWLLSPLNQDFLGEKSNIVKFASRFELLDVEEIKDNYSLYYTVFEATPDTPTEKLPRDNALRSAYAKLFEEGGKALSGCGIFFLDDPKPKKSPFNA